MRKRYSSALGTSMNDHPHTYYVRTARRFRKRRYLLVKRLLPPTVLHLKPPKFNETKVEMFEGDACVYAGTEVEHWRERFRIGGYIQLFLHFVAKHSPNYPKLMFDGRECLGADFERQRKQTLKKA